MRKLLLISAFFLFASSAFAQINIGPPGAIKPTNFKKKDMELYLSLKTYFVIREVDKENQATIEKILQQVWKFNKYEIIDFDKYKSMPEDGNAIFFGLRNYNTSFNYTSNSDLFGKYATSNELKIELWRNLPKKEPQILNEDVLAYMILTSTPNYAMELRNRKCVDAFEYICKTDTFVEEWGWGFLKNTLQEINRHLVANEARWRFASGVDKENISKLNSQILYVPTNIKRHFDPRENGAPFEKYAGKKIEMISPSDLSAKILDSETPFYYMQLYFPGSDKVISIRNSATGEFLYSEYSGMKYYFSEKDIKELNGNLK